ncbi:MAG: anti-sigma factor family protein [Gemmataceae bacterium]
MTLTCKQLAEMLHQFLDGELESGQSDGIRIHLESCPPCVAYIETYKLTIEISRKLKPKPLPEALQQRLTKAVSEMKGTSPAE